MNIKSVDRIIKARDIAPDSTPKGYFLRQAELVRINRGVALDVSSLDNPSGTPVFARIENGQFIADCECNGASFVDDEFPAFMCYSCGNRSNEGKARPVVFPKDRAEIEAALLERPVDDVRGITDAERAASAQPLIFIDGKGGLGRDWNPGETLADLHGQQDKIIVSWKKNLKKR